MASFDLRHSQVQEKTQKANEEDTLLDIISITETTFDKNLESDVIKEAKSCEYEASHAYLEGESLSETVAL